MADEFELPPLKRPARYGIYRWWPEEGEDWIHPYDIGIVRQMIPGLRVFRREDLDDDWELVSYGDIQFRVKPTIWLQVAHEGFNVGDYVEIKSRMGQAQAFMGRIKESVWNQRYACIEYYLYRSDKIQTKAYHKADLNPASAIQKFKLSESDSPPYNGPASGGGLPKTW